jgi:hypothetical protein
MVSLPLSFKGEAMGRMYRGEIRAYINENCSRDVFQFVELVNTFERHDEPYVAVIGPLDSDSIRIGHMRKVDIAVRPQRAVQALKAHCNRKQARQTISTLKEYIRSLHARIITCGDFWVSGEDTRTRSDSFRHGSMPFP